MSAWIAEVSIIDKLDHEYAVELAIGYRFVSLARDGGPRLVDVPPGRYVMSTARINSGRPVSLPILLVSVRDEHVGQWLALEPWQIANIFASVQSKMAHFSTVAGHA